MCERIETAMLLTRRWYLSLVLQSNRKSPASANAGLFLLIPLTSQLREIDHGVVNYATYLLSVASAFMISSIEAIISSAVTSSLGNITEKFSCITFAKVSRSSS